MIKKYLLLFIILFTLTACRDKDNNAIDPFEASKDMVDVVDNASESANILNVESYIHTIEYAVLQYEMDHSGNVPTTFCDIYPYIGNSNISCLITFDDLGNVTAKNCQVGEFTKHSYMYDGAVKVEDETKFYKNDSCN